MFWWGRRWGRLRLRVSTVERPSLCMRATHVSQEMIPRCGTQMTTLGVSDQTRLPSSWHAYCMCRRVVEAVEGQLMGIQLF